MKILSFILIVFIFACGTETPQDAVVEFTDTEKINLDSFEFVNIALPIYPLLPREWSKKSHEKYVSEMKYNTLSFEKEYKNERWNKYIQFTELNINKVVNLKSDFKLIETGLYEVYENSENNHSLDSLINTTESELLRGYHAKLTQYEDEYAAMLLNYNRYSTKHDSIASHYLTNANTWIEHLRKSQMNCDEAIN